MKSLQKDLEDALRRARGDADHFKKQLTEAHRVAMSQASVAASVASVVNNPGYATLEGSGGTTAASPSDAASISSQSGSISGLYSVKGAAGSGVSYSVPPIDGE